jgi:hypothetical protein
VSWQGLNFDFTGVVFDGSNFTGAQFSRGRVSFHDAEFSGGTVSFEGARFSGGTVSFTFARFSGGQVGTLLARDRAAHAALDDPGGVARLLDGRADLGRARPQVRPSLVLLEHRPAPQDGKARRASTWSASAPTAARTGWPYGRPAQDNTRHAGLELWMAVHGHQVVGKPATWFDSCED